MKKHKVSSKHIVGGERFVGGRCKLTTYRKNWNTLRPVTTIITKQQAKRLLAEDTEQNYPSEEGW